MIFLSEQDRAILATKGDIEKSYGSLGGAVFDHLLHTIKLMYQADSGGTFTPDLSAIDVADRERLQKALGVAQTRSQDRIRGIIQESHNGFVKMNGKSGIKVTYAYSGDPKDKDAKRTLILGDMAGKKGVVDMDLSKWLKIGAELY